MVSEPTPFPGHAPPRSSFSLYMQLFSKVLVFNVRPPEGEKQKNVQAFNKLQSSKIVTSDKSCRRSCCLCGQTDSWSSLLRHLPRTLTESLAILFVFLGTCPPHLKYSVCWHTFALGTSLYYFLFLKGHSS